MKRGLRILVLLLLFTIIFSTEVFALRTSYTDEIKIDGNFNDWEDKPYVIDYKRDIISPWLNFLEVRYFADDKYLYLYVERVSAKKSEPWDFKVIILNAERGRKYVEEVPVKYTHYQVHNYYRPSKFAKMKFTQFDIESNYTYKKSHNGTPIKVSFEGKEIETTLSASNNNKIIEFRIPLEKVGLDGPNKEVEFMLKSVYDENAIDKYGNIFDEHPYDWVPNGEPIIVTTGPTYWQMTSMVFFIVVSFIAYRIYKKKEKSA